MNELINLLTTPIQILDGELQVWMVIGFTLIIFGIAKDNWNES